MEGLNPAKAKLQNPSSRLQAPSSQLRIAEILRILRGWGIHTLGELAALEKEELRNRLGPEAVRLWERANGTATRLLKFVQPPETFDESFEFDHEIETAEPLLFILRRFLEQLALRLGSIYLVARELTLTITFSNSQQDEPTNASLPRRNMAKAGTARTFKIPQPTNDVDLLFRMLQTHLENFKSDHPIVAVALRAEPIRPGSQQFGLFETALRNPHQLYETLARLTALIGNDRVGTAVLEETHRPDAFRMEGFVWGRNEVGTARCAVRGHRSAVSLPIALRRFRPPANTSVFVSDRRYLQSDKVRGQIMNQSGPFLLSGNWWDEKTWSRAEWDIQLENGELVRAHESPPSSDYGATNSADGIWKIDGIYD